MAPDDSPTEVRPPDTAPTPPAAFAPADTAATAATPPPVPPRPAASTTNTPPPAPESPFADAPSDPGPLAAAFPPEQPERAVGAAFAGGLVLALILKRLAR